MKANQLDSIADQTGITYRYERIRALAVGMLETAPVTFLMLIAVRHFECGPTAKAIIAAASSIGYVLSPLVVHVVAKAQIRASLAAAYFSIAASLGYLITLIVPRADFFIVGGLIGVAANSMATPLVTHMYQENYPASIRGKLFSRSVMIRIAVAALFSDLAGRALTGRLPYYQVLMAIFLFAGAFSAYCLARCPTSAIREDARRGVFSGMRYIKTDRVFRQTLICWMLMGFANLMMLPLRVDYVANPKYGLELSVSLIALLTGVIPNLARFFLVPLWGSLFDRVNFFMLRILVNLGFAVGILSFFTSDSLTGLVIGAILFGISNAGGDIAWSLWVTKFAPAELVAEYMAVHSFFTGVRGMVAPFAGFYLAQTLTLSTLGALSTSLIVLASVLLIPEYRYEKQRLGR